MIPKRIDDITSNLSVRVYKAFHIRQAADWYEKKTKTMHTIWVVTKGRVWINIDDNEYLVGPGGVALFYPNDHYSAHTDADGCEFMYLFFTLEMGSGIDLMSDMNLAGVISPQLIADQAISFCKKYLRLSSANQRMSLKSYALFLEFLCIILSIQKRSTSIRFHKRLSSTSNKGILKALDYIAKNYRTPISVRQLAQIANISEKRFINSFNYIVGTSPCKYITQCRMREAAELLITTDICIREIGVTVGYSDQYAFSKAFKRSYGEAPTKFRENARPLKHA